MAVPRVVHMCLPYMVEGLLNEKLGFVTSYDMVRCALLLLSFYSFAVLNIMELCNFGAVGVVFLLSCKALYVFGMVDSFFCCFHLIERLKFFYKN